MAAARGRSHPATAAPAPSSYTTTGWRQNVRRMELTSLPAHLEGWNAVPGLMYTVLVAGLRLDPSGQLFLEDVHMTFAANSGMSQGAFEAQSREMWLAIADQR